MTTPEEKPPITPPKRPKRLRKPRKDANAPLTQEDFAEQMRALSEKAKAAGLSPIRTMFNAYATQGMAMIESMMGALENADTSKTSAKSSKKRK